MKSSVLKMRRTPSRAEARFTPFRDVSFSYEGSGVANPVRVPDLSPSGMFINTADILSEGSILKVKFRLPDSEEVIKVRGEVRYCVPGVGVGLEFIEILPEHRQAIQYQMLLARGKVVPDGD